MKKLALVFLALCACALPSLAHMHQQPLTEREMDRLIQSMEKNGKLDAAFERALERFSLKMEAKQRERETQAAAAQKALNLKVRKPDAGRDHVWGNPDAEVSLIMFSDFECPFCKRFHSTPQEVVEQSDGRINLVWRHFPLGFHNPMAQREAEASECAAKQGGSKDFWRYANAVMERTNSNGKGLPTQSSADPLVALASELNLDTQAFSKCLESGEMRSRVEDDLTNGQMSGIAGTPGIIIHHNKTGEVRAVNGALPASALEAEVRALISR